MQLVFSYTHYKAPAIYLYVCLMAATKYSSSLAERVPSKVVRRQLAFLSLHPWAHFFPSACRLAADQGMAHAAFGRVMCHMNPINTQPGPVGCWNDFGIQNVQDPPPQKTALWPAM